jgi:geranylgeranyl transferase type-2 subunit alpha
MSATCYLTYATTQVENKNFDTSTLRLTSQILQHNPDYYTIWNYRREILLNGIFLDANEEEKDAIYKQELGFFMELIRINPKSYWLWNHRRWCLATMANPDWKQELKLVGKMLDLDARNCKYCPSLTHELESFL